MDGFINLKRSELIQNQSEPIQLPDVTHWLALYNCNVYWIVPACGENITDIPSSTQYLLLKQSDGGYTIMLPLISGDMKASLCGSERGIIANIQGALSGEEPENAELLYIAHGSDPYKLSAEAVKAVSKRLGSFKIREEKRTPDFLDYLGWCTWDAFYGAVDEEKVIMGLESFKSAGFPLGFMILDDGSWDTYYDSLNSISVNPDKFSDGLHGLIRTAKNKYGIKIFGVWHCFEGYWGGIRPDGVLAGKYRLIKNEANIRPWEEKEVIQDIYFIHPDDAEQFYEEIHSYLHSEGADMLKIDGQSAMDLFTKGKIGQGGAMRKYQQSMQKSAEKYFDSRVIHCMSNSNDVAYNMMATNCWRNSYDYAPKDMKMQQEHIYINAMNAMWTSAFSVPDWDMFQSHSAGAEIHAAARAICGGPVYVCDYPGKQNFDILRKLITSDGKTLKCDYPALPTEDCLFDDYRKEKKLLKIFNISGSIGVLGLFNCCDCEDMISGNFSANDIPVLNGEEFAVYYNRAGKLFTAGKNDVLDTGLKRNEYELVSFSQIVNGIAPLGLIDKYNNSAAVISFSENRGVFTARICDGGQIGFYCSKEPKKVICCGGNAKYSYAPSTGMLVILSDIKGTNTIEITL